MWIVAQAVTIQDVVLYLFIIFLVIYYNTCVRTHVLCQLFVIPEGNVKRTDTSAAD